MGRDYLSNFNGFCCFLGLTAFQAISNRLPERKKKKRKMASGCFFPNNRIPATTANTVGTCSTIFQISRTPSSVPYYCNGNGEAKMINLLISRVEDIVKLSAIVSALLTLAYGRAIAYCACGSLGWGFLDIFLSSVLSNFLSASLC